MKFIVVAESHIRTSGKEVRALIDSSKLPRNMPKNSPLNFVKLVYCLAYGEPFLLEKPRLVENNAGTPDYVNLLKNLSDYQESDKIGLTRKVNILKAFKKKGLWLLDASVHACYLGSDERLPDDLVCKIIPLSWKNYIRPIIDYTRVKPENVWIIGKTTHDLLHGKYIRDENWIYQPRAKIPDTEKNGRLDELKLAIQKATE